ncbi:MAG: NUDIX hydrolase [Candidatus Aenigmarchaeota archaeon]|nr:NUDIX hydrolase [Candidatus Aenigmarchaeota archaeon]
MKQAADVMVVDNQGCCLLLKRSLHAQYSPGLWGFPGGKVDGGETPYLASVRELGEETGIEAIPQKEPFAICYYPENKKEGAILEVFVYKVMLSGRPEVKLSSEHTAYIWSPLEDLPGPEEMILCTREAFRKILGGLAQT